eukprot:g21616.t1
MMVVCPGNVQHSHASFRRIKENPQLCEPFFLSRQAAGSLRTAFREILRAKSRRCRRRLMAKEDSFDGSSSRRGRIHVWL